MNPTTKRNDLIFTLRKQGKSFAEIGRQFQLSSGRVRQIYFREERKRFRPKDWLDELGVKIVSLLERAGLESREQVLAAYTSGLLKPGEFPKKYGWKTHKAVAKALGLPEPFKHKRLCPHCGKPSF